MTQSYLYLSAANLSQPFPTPNLEAEAKSVADKVLREMNGFSSPSGPSSSSGTATPTTPREGASNTPSASPLSQPVQTVNHKLDYGFAVEASSQTNIGRMPRHDEELSPKIFPARFRSRQTMKSENEPLSVKEGEDKSNVESTVSDAVDERK